MRKKRQDLGSLDLRINPEWEAVKAAWDPCRDVLARAGLTDDETYQLAMVARELLENAVKFGSFAEGERIQLSIRAGAEDVVVEVKSHVGVGEANLLQFDRTIQWIRGFQNPFEAFVERMKTVSAQPYSEEETGLGLTRDPFLNTGAGNMWVNVGISQFHLPTGQPDVLRGVTGLVVPDRAALLDRLTQMRKPLEGTKFDFRENNDCVETVCPWGNRINVHAPDETRFGRIVLGMPYIEFDVRPGTADRIARFYRDIMGALATVIESASPTCPGSAPPHRRPNRTPPTSCHPSSSPKRLRERRGT